MAAKKKAKLSRKKTDWRKQARLWKDTAKTNQKNSDYWRETARKRENQRASAVSDLLDTQNMFSNYERRIVEKGLTVRKELASTKKELMFYKGIFSLMGDHAAPHVDSKNYFAAEARYDPLIQVGADEWKRKGSSETAEIQTDKNTEVSSLRERKP